MSYLHHPDKSKYPVNARTKIKWEHDLSPENLAAIASPKKIEILN
jgi:hypothetical protein